MSKRILLVEDDVDSQTVVAQISTYLQHSIDVASSAEEAQELLAEYGHDYDLVIIDLRLPGQNGWELFNAIKEDEELTNMPCIAVTGYSDTTVEREALAAGFDYFVAKPITATNLADIFAEILA